MTGAETYPGSGQPKLRVRCPRDYKVPFNIDVGQRNATFVKRPFPPLRRILPAADAFVVVPDRDFDLIHTKNPVPVLTNRPFVITYESYLPRVTERTRSPRLEAWLRRRLLSDQCLALVPQSQYAWRQFRWQNRDSPQLPALEAKSHLVHPAVALRSTAPKKPSGKLKLLFVGKKFMRKGGPALVRAHERLRDAGLPVETTVVSALQWTPDDYAGPSEGEYVAQQTARLAQEGITHHVRLPNSEVLRLMGQADFFVLPTVHDTFGFVTIEAMATGTPVIATDTCALPEVVEHKACGYLLPIENDLQVGKWTWISRRREPGYLDAYDSTMNSLADSLTETLTEHWESGVDYEAMSQAALDRVRLRFSRERARDAYEPLYELARARRSRRRQARS